MDQPHSSQVGHTLERLSTTDLGCCETFQIKEIGTVPKYSYALLCKETKEHMDEIYYPNFAPE